MDQRISWIRSSSGMFLCWISLAAGLQTHKTNLGPHPRSGQAVTICVGQSLQSGALVVGLGPAWKSPQSPRHELILSRVSISVYSALLGAGGGDSHQAAARLTEVSHPRTCILGFPGIHCFIKKAEAFPSSPCFSAWPRAPVWLRTALLLILSPLFITDFTRRCAGFKGAMYKSLATPRFDPKAKPQAQMANLSPPKGVSLKVDFSFYDWYMLKQDPLASNELSKRLV